MLMRITNAIDYRHSVKLVDERGCSLHVVGERTFMIAAYCLNVNSSFATRKCRMILWALLMTFGETARIPFAIKRA